MEMIATAFTHIDHGFVGQTFVIRCHDFKPIRVWVSFFRFILLSAYKIAIPRVHYQAKWLTCNGSFIRQLLAGNEVFRPSANNLTPRFVCT